MKVNKSLYLTVLLGSLVLVFSHCFDDAGSVSSDPRGSAYAGSQACVSCHQNIMATHKQSAHARTSGLVDEASMQTKKLDQGSFLFNDGSEVRFEVRNREFFQVAYKNGKEVRAERMDIALGSGDKAQTFASWQGNLLTQLPLTYFKSIHGWANSPGYPMAASYFDRPIQSRCIECHGSYTDRELISGPNLTVTEQLQPQSMVLGIDCERCHGPAADHVAFAKANPGKKDTIHIARWASLSRQRQLDACAVCHSGNDQSTIRSTFGFKPGDTLSSFYLPSFGAGGGNEADVHGKQMQLLASSQCFMQSVQMVCTTCHDPHANQSNQLAVYSAKCITCHEPESAHDCPKAKTLGRVIEKNCIDCHMPEQASRKINFQKSGASETTPYLLRTHRIAIYP